MVNKMNQQLLEIMIPTPAIDKICPWFIIKKKLLTTNQCDTILKEMHNRGRYYKNNSDLLDKKSAYKYIDQNKFNWVYKKLASAFVRNNIWGFTLSGIVDLARLYKFDPGSYCGLHSDVDYETGDYSKITAVIPLVKRRSWTGGHLRIGNSLVTPKFDKGDCVFFPSFTVHEVTPVERGCRFVLAAWVYGPPLK